MMLKYWDNKAFRELLLIILLAIGVYTFAARVDLFESITAWIENIEKYSGVEMDELIIVCIFLAIAFAIYAFRRWQETLQEIRRRQEKETELVYFNSHDSLTRLYNRNYFEKCLIEFEGVDNFPLGIIVCDVNALKLVNDTVGHVKGDWLITTVADAIRRVGGKNATAFRIGGDEFAVILNKTSEENIEIAVNEIQHILEEFSKEKADFTISVSTGFAVSESPMPLREIYQRADSTMYRQKLNFKFNIRNSIVEKLSKTLEVRDYIAEGHTERIEDLVLLLAEEMDLEEYRLQGLRLFARFHDLGKVGVPDSLLQKPGPLSTEEFETIKQHSVIGYRIALASGELSPIADLILLHHEWWDGNGYPMQKAGTEIPPECRMLNIADAFDAMTHDRPYRQAKTYEAAVAELIRCKGTQFDPRMVDIIVEKDLFKRN
jgi:diguanylate cyclase (GGDEF)-like protein